MAGASRGIGFEVARGLARQGTTVVMVARNAGRLAGAAAQLVTEGLDVTAEPVDLTDVHAVRALPTRLGPLADIDVLVNAAGVMSQPMSKTLRTSDEHWRAVLDLNLNGAFTLTSTFVPSMVARRTGRVIHLSACLGRMSGPGTSGGLAPYRISKAALNAMVKNLASEVGGGRRGSSWMPSAPVTAAPTWADRMPREPRSRAPTLCCGWQHGPTGRPVCCGRTARSLPGEPAPGGLLPQTDDMTGGTRARRSAIGTALLGLVLLAGCSGGDDPTLPAPTRPSLATAAPPSSADPSPATVAPLSWKPCADGFECATLPVALVEDDPAQGTIDLALTRRKATEPERRIGSLIVNPGGPGASAVDYLQAAWTNIPAPVRARFDLVAFDPRGVGRSAPVRCADTAELDTYFALDPSPDNPDELAALVDGNAELAAGCEQRSSKILPHVSTIETARDVDTVRAAVGDDKLSYLGYSYGTTLGATYLDRYPTHVRVMVLDGGIDPTLTWNAFLAGQSTGFDRALEAFLANCQRTRCAFRKAVDGDLTRAYDTLAARVEDAPLPTGEKRRLGPGEFSLGVGAGLYSKSSGWPAIAAGLAAAQNGDGSILLQLSDSYLDRGPDGYKNVSEANFAVNCLDRPWPTDVAAYTALADRIGASAPRFGPAIALSGLGCASWPVPPVSAPHPVAGTGAPPVVVIGTTRDPATPYVWSVALAGQLDSGVLLTHEGDGHTVYRVGAPDCITEPVDRYLLTMKAPAPATC